MLEPRKADVPVFFLVLVVLPVVVYILLGKWSEASRRKVRINLLVEEAAVESSPEAMATANVIPIVPSPTPAFRKCARCHGPASTRCSRCKSVRYCSGKCQIIHWRQGHKDECRPLDSMNSSFKSDTMEEAGFPKDFFHKGSHPEFIACSAEQPMQERVQSDVTYPPINPSATAAGPFSVSASATMNGSWIPKPERRVSEKRVLHKSTKEMLDSRDMMANASSGGNMRNIANLSKDAYAWHKKGGGSINTEGGFTDEYVAVVSNVCTDWSGALQQSFGIKNQNGNAPTKNSVNHDEVDADCTAPTRISPRYESNCIEELLQKKSSPDMVSSNVSIGSKVTTNGECVISAKSPKLMSREATEQIKSAKARKGHGSDESADLLFMREVTGMGNSSAHGRYGTTSAGSIKAMGLKKSSKLFRQDMPEMDTGSHQKIKVLFPYEEFTKFFEQEVFDLSPRGLLNCGNSCYANAVLQCLTCTKPLTMYLLSRTHSRACCLKNWCLLCELEQHVMILKEVGGPLSPSRILSHIRRNNCQIGDGSQEDAHEFLRLLVASMQSICLEEAGGESQVHPSSQETTFVQQTFGGCLRSMVKCLRCHHESERYENIMDLTLEIFGWVESLEDALTQFTTPEDLDGENMYRCGRCASYVRARKQLSIDEAPNILTIVLKRFQEGNYGKINKCISFPEMLDMIPFMTGTNDTPPLYMLYGVVVHVDTLNASFSGHYVSYVKELQGNWFRIDDSVVQPVPMSQVMSEGAYILFYRRSCPRPPRDCWKATRKQATAYPSRHSVLKTHRLPEIGRSIHRASNKFTPAIETHAEVIGMEFSDVTSSDWSLFTSSDEASFTSESTRDSFSAADYSDTCKIDPFCSKFNPSHRTISCRMFSGSKPMTRYVSEQQGYILDSDNSINYLNDVQIVGNLSQVSLPSSEGFLSDNGYQNFVYYESSPVDGFLRTFSNCQL